MIFGLDIHWRMSWNVVIGFTIVCGDPCRIIFIGRCLLANCLKIFISYLHVTFGGNFGRCVSVCGLLDSSWKDVL